MSNQQAYNIVGKLTSQLEHISHISYKSGESSLPSLLVVQGSPHPFGCHEQMTIRCLYGTEIRVLDRKQLGTAHRPTHQTTPSVNDLPPRRRQRTTITHCKSHPFPETANAAKPIIHQRVCTTVRWKKKYNPRGKTSGDSACIMPTRGGDDNRFQMLRRCCATRTRG
jgi:hypothetical protein